MRRRRRRGSKAPRRYRWSFSCSDDDSRVRLFAIERRGLAYAQQLADNAWERSRTALEGGLPPYPLTVQDLAREEGVSPVTVHTAIKYARIALFGKDLSDSAIYYRLRRERRLGSLEGRTCQEEGCDRELPEYATARRHYCAIHAAGAARVRRHRQRGK